jgi:hypothetical protein
VIPVLADGRPGVAEINARIRCLMEAPASPERTDRYVRLLQEWAEAHPSGATVTATATEL